MIHGTKDLQQQLKHVSSVTSYTTFQILHARQLCCGRMMSFASCMVREVTLSVVLAVVEHSTLQCVVIESWTNQVRGAKAERLHMYRQD
jgi:hypothetical protein